MKEWHLYVGGIIFLIIMIVGMMFFSRVFNAATLQTQVINPKNGIECVVISASDSTSVDCWKTE